ncbi:hypothetical protein C0995_006594 [Termitomyces sp. Mi166|nr:hypothetical protein C0995_006594 [Termitomyces sp. Mi166\
MVTPQPIPVSKSEPTTSQARTDSQKPIMNEPDLFNSLIVPAISHRVIQESLDSIKKVLAGHGHYGDIHLVSYFDNQGLAQGLLVETVILTYKKKVIGKSCANTIATFFTHDCALLIRSGPNTQEQYFSHRRPSPTLDSIVAARQSNSVGGRTGNRGGSGRLGVSSTNDVNRGTTEGGHHEFSEGQNTSSGVGSGHDDRDNRGSDNDGRIDGEGDYNADERSGGGGGGGGGGNTENFQEFKLAFLSTVAVQDDENQNTLFSFNTKGVLSLRIKEARISFIVPSRGWSTIYELQPYDLPRCAGIEESIETSKKRTGSFKATLSLLTPALEGGGSIRQTTVRNIHHPLPPFEVIPESIAPLAGTENKSWIGTSWRYFPWSPRVTTVFAPTQETVPWILFAYLSRTPMSLDNTFQARIISTWVPTKEASPNGFSSIIHVTVLSIPLSALGAMNEGYCDMIQTSASVVKGELKFLAPPVRKDYTLKSSSSVSEAEVWNASTALYAELSPPSLGSQVYEMQRIGRKFSKNKV